MRPLRFMIRNAAPPELQGKVTAYASRLYRKRYERLGWRARPGDSSDTKLLRESVIRFMVMEVRDEKARARAARFGRTHMGFGTKAKPGVVDPQLVGLVLATAIQGGGPAVFEHLLAQLDSNADATTRNRVLSALGHAEAPELSTRALDLALDARLRVNEVNQVLRPQFHNPRTRDRAWTWLTTHFNELTDRFGPARGGETPWYAASFCSDERAEEVAAFFEPRVAKLAGGPRNLAGVVEAIALCAEKARIYRPGVEKRFDARNRATRP